MLEVVDFRALLMCLLPTLEMLVQIMLIHGAGTTQGVTLVLTDENEI